MSKRFLNDNKLIDVLRWFARREQVAYRVISRIALYKDNEQGPVITIR